MIVRKVTIVFRGETAADAEDAFDEAVELLKNGYISGKDSNESSGFYFTNSGDVPANGVPA